MLKQILIDQKTEKSMSNYEKILIDLDNEQLVLYVFWKLFNTISYKVFNQRLIDGMHHRAAFKFVNSLSRKELKEWYKK